MSEDNDAPTEPNPVADIILTRTLQASAGVLTALLIVRRQRGRTAVRPMLPVATALTVGGLSAYFVATFSPRTRFLGQPRPMTRLATPNAVALTFDDGPFPETTPALLDLLAAYDARATFFLVGERAAAHPALVRRIAAEGHAIGLHGFRHRTMALMPANRARREFAAARQAIENALGCPLRCRLLRPPYGFRTWTLDRAAQRMGWTIVAWSCDARDYEPGATPERIAQRIRETIAAGDIVLMHERPRLSEMHSLAALPTLLQFVRDRGWVCLPLGESCAGE